MKSTKIMLACLATYILTWLVFSFFIYLMSDASYKDVNKEVGVVMFMLILGWIPAIIVGSDLDDKLK